MTTNLRCHSHSDRSSCGFYWYSVKQRRKGFLLLRLQRARDLERIAGLDHHRSIFRADGPRGWALNPTSVIRIRRVESWVSIALVWAWLALFLPVISACVAAVIVGLVSLVAITGDIREGIRRARQT
jgi:hypothetical protein